MSNINQKLKMSNINQELNIKQEFKRKRKTIGENLNDRIKIDFSYPTLHTDCVNSLLWNCYNGYKCKFIPVDYMNCTVRSYSGFDHIYKVGFNALWGNRLFGNATWTNWNIHQYNNGALQTHRYINL